MLRRRRCPAFALARQIVERVVKSPTACKSDMRRMESSLTHADMDVQELQMGHQRSRRCERGFEHDLVGFAAATGTRMVFI